MCGIFGYSGNNFNKYKFNILGLFNDSRGGDSCGVFIGNKDKKQLAYGSDKTKLYSDFIASGVELDFNDVNFALGHCRKASVGGIGHAQAQPVVIRDANDNIVFVMIHNGTLVNYKELADKYGVDYLHTETDSQIFGKTVWKAGYRVLDEYDGAGAFIFWDSRDGDNTIKVFKGASLYYENDKELYIERPLYTMYNDNSMWFSSIESSLEFINDENYKIKSLDCNVLFTIMGGKIIGEDKVDRSQRKQIDKLAWNNKFPMYNKAAYGYGNYDKELPWNRNKNLYSEWEGWDDNYSEYKVTKKLTEGSTSDKPTVIDYYKTEGIIVDKNPKAYKDKIYYDVDGRYKINETLCHGEYNATIAGYINVQNNYRRYYFIDGVMMKSFFDYLCAQEYCLINFGEEYAGEVYPFYLTRYSATPTPMDWEDAASRETGVIFHTWDEKELKEVELNACFSPYFTFSREVYDVEDGVLMEWYRYSDKNEYIQDPLTVELDKKILDKTIGEELLLQMIYENI